MHTHDINWGARSSAPQLHVTDLLIVDHLSSLAYFVMTYTLSIAGKLPIKTYMYVARLLPTNTDTQIPTIHMYALYTQYTHTRTHTFTKAYKYVQLTFLPVTPPPFILRLPYTDANN